MRSSAMRRLGGSRTTETPLPSCWRPKVRPLACLCYQFAGGSNSTESLAPEGGGVWRCLAVEKLSQVELRKGALHTEPRSKR
jgi:hypothetical protein